MQTTKREVGALYLGGFLTVMPVILVPNGNRLPDIGWLLFSILGSAIAGAIASPRYWWRGSISAVLASAGARLALWAYLDYRGGMVGPKSFYRLEMTFALMVGAFPGLLLFGEWAKDCTAIASDEATAVANRSPVLK